MLNHTGTLWHYLGSFVLYTLGAIALIYGAYWYARRATANTAASNGSDDPPAALLVESSLELEPRKTLYVVRSGNERFLVAASGETTQLLSRLETEEPEAPIEIPVVQETPRLEPWYSTTPKQAAPMRHVRQQSFGSRFVQSVQWLVSSRMK